MIKNQRDLHKALDYVWAAADVADARVGIWEGGEPVVTVTLPKNRPGVDFAAIRQALRDGRIIVRLCSADRLESVEFVLNHMVAMGYRPRFKKPRVRR